jgi:hypothetical protein
MYIRCSCNTVFKLKTNSRSKTCGSFTTHIKRNPTHYEVDRWTFKPKSGRVVKSVGKKGLTFLEQ